LGFAAFFSACWCVGTWYCDWYGSNSTPLIIAPFVLMMGLAEICAALWCFPARDSTGTVFHGTWGALFTAWGVVNIMTAQKFFIPVIAKYGEADEFAMWLVTAAAITGCCCLVTFARDVLISSVCLMQFIGSVLIFSGMFKEMDESNTIRLMKAGGYFWMFSSLLALLRTAIYCLPQIRQDEYTDLISSKAYRGQARVAVPIGEPGVRKGQ
jgi:succinate-acetate transporter protein